MMKQLRAAADDLGRTIVIVLHDINFAAHYSDKILAMKHGQVVKHGTPDEIMQNQVLSEIFNTEITVIEGPSGPLAVYY